MLILIGTVGCSYVCVGGNLIGLSGETLKGFMGFIQMRFEVNGSLSSLKKKSVSECTAFKII